MEKRKETQQMVGKKDNYCELKPLNKISLQNGSQPTMMGIKCTKCHYFSGKFSSG